MERALARRLSGLGAVDRVVRFGDEISPAELVSELRTPGLFGAGRAVVVRRADPLARERGLAEELAAGLPPDTAVFFTGQDLSGPLARVAQEAKAFPRPTIRELKRLAAELLAEAGLPPHPQAVEFLAEACRDSSLRLEREVEKLALWGKELSPRDLEALVFFSGTPPYAYLDALVEGRIGGALGELRRLLTSGWDPFKVFFLVVSHLRAVLAAKAAWEDGRPPAGPEWLAKKRLAQARRFTQGKLIELLGRLQELDLAIKTGELSPEWALQLFTLELAP